MNNLRSERIFLVELFNLNRPVFQNPFEFVAHSKAFGIGQKLGKNEEQIWINFCKIFSIKILDFTVDKTNKNTKKNL